MVFPRIPVCIYFFALKGLRIICTKNNKSALKGHKSCILATFSSSTDDVKVCKQPSAFTFFFSTKMPVWKFWTKRHAFEPSAGLVEMVRFQSSSVIVLLHHVHRGYERTSECRGRRCDLASKVDSTERIMQRTKLASNGRNWENKRRRTIRTSKVVSRRLYTTMCFQLTDVASYEL